MCKNLCLLDECKEGKEKDLALWKAMKGHEVIIQKLIRPYKERCCACTFSVPSKCVCLTSVPRRDKYA